MDEEYLKEDYIPENKGCNIPMIAAVPGGCPDVDGMHYEPYVFRTQKMAQTSDTFVPCCKKSRCKVDDIACRSELENAWVARVVRFSDTAQFISNTLFTSLGSLQQFTTMYQPQLDAFFRIHKDQHEEATLKMNELIEIGAIIRRDLQHCVNVFITLTDEGPNPIPVASVTPRGRLFEIMRAEAVSSGCGSLERLLAIARSDFYPRYMELVDRLRANSASNRYGNQRRKRPDTYSEKVWAFALRNLERLSNQAQSLNVSTVSFYMLTVVPFLYTSILTMGVAVPAVLLAKDKLTMLARCMKLFCHFTQIPGLFVGLGILLTNKLTLYLQQRKSKQKLQDDVANGAMTFFTLMEKLIHLNPVAATGIAALGFTKAAGAKIVRVSSDMLAQTVTKVADLGDQAGISFMAQTMQGILMFIMTILSSSIWKAVGMTCKTATKVTAATVEGTAALASGAGTFLSGMSHLTSQLYNAAGQTVGFGLGAVGTAADTLGDKVKDFMDIFKTDKDILNNLSNQDIKVEETLESLNGSLVSILGVTSEGLRDNIIDVLNTAFDPKKVKEVEALFRDGFKNYKVEMQIVFTVWAVAYGTWSWFQPVNDSAFDKSISAILKDTQTEMADWDARTATDYAKRFNRIVPRPPANFVYQQCLHEDLSRHDICLDRVQQWTGLTFQPKSDKESLPPAYDETPRRRRGSARRATGKYHLREV